MVMLHKAVAANDVEKVKRLLAISYTNPNERDKFLQTPLHVSCYNANHAIVEELLTHGADVNIRDRNYWTPLLCAAQSGDLSIVESLLAREGVNVTICSKDGTSALHYLVRVNAIDVNAQKKLEEVLDHLKKKIPTVDIKGKHAEMPLHQAVLRGNKFTTQWLLDNGASVDAQNRIGETALHYAARNNDKQMVHLLLERGARCDIESTEGLPVKLASNEEVKEILLMHSSQGSQKMDMSSNDSLSPSMENLSLGDRTPPLENSGSSLQNVAVCKSPEEEVWQSQPAQPSHPSQPTPGSSQYQKTIIMPSPSPTHPSNAFQQTVMLPSRCDSGGQYGNVTPPMEHDSSNISPGFNYVAHPDHAGFQPSVTPPHCNMPQPDNNRDSGQFAPVQQSPHHPEPNPHVGPVPVGPVSSAGSASSGTGSGAYNDMANMVAQQANMNVEGVMQWNQMVQQQMEQMNQMMYIMNLPTTPPDQKMQIQKMLADMTAMMMNMPQPMAQHQFMQGPQQTQQPQQTMQPGGTQAYSPQQMAMMEQQQMLLMQQQQQQQQHNQSPGFPTQGGNYQQTVNLGQQQWGAPQGGGNHQ